LGEEGNNGESSGEGNNGESSEDMPGNPGRSDNGRQNLDDILNPAMIDCEHGDTIGVDGEGNTTYCTLGPRGRAPHDAKISPRYVEADRGWSGTTVDDVINDFNAGRIKCDGESNHIGFDKNARPMFCTTATDLDKNRLAKPIEGYKWDSLGMYQCKIGGSSQECFLPSVAGHLNPHKP